MQRSTRKQEDSLDVELAEWKRELEEVKSSISEMRGEKRSLETRLKDEYGLAPTQVDKEIRLLDREIAEAKKKLETLRKALTEKFRIDE